MNKYKILMRAIQFANFFSGDTGARIALLVYLMSVGYYIYGWQWATISFLCWGIVAFELVVEPLLKNYRHRMHSLGNEIVQDLKELIRERGL